MADIEKLEFVVCDAAHDAVAWFTIPYQDMWKKSAADDYQQQAVTEATRLGDGHYVKLVTEYARDEERIWPLEFEDDDDDD